MSKAMRVYAKLLTYPGTPAQQAAAFHGAFDLTEPPGPLSLSGYSQVWADAHDEKYGEDAALPWE